MALELKGSDVYAADAVVMLCVHAAHGLASRNVARRALQGPDFGDRHHTQRLTRLMTTTRKRYQLGGPSDEQN